MVHLLWGTLILIIVLSFYGGLAFMALFNMAGQESDREQELEACPYKVEPRAD